MGYLFVSVESFYRRRLRSGTRLNRSRLFFGIILPVLQMTRIQSVKMYSRMKDLTANLY